MSNPLNRTVTALATDKAALDLLGEIETIADEWSEKMPEPVSFKPDTNEGILLRSCQKTRLYSLKLWPYNGMFVLNFNPKILSNDSRLTNLTHEILALLRKDHWEPNLTPKAKRRRRKHEFQGRRRELRTAGFGCW